MQELRTAVASKQVVAGQPRELRVGTFFSGSDVAISATDSTFLCWQTPLGASLKLRHVFSVEIVKWKRELISNKFAPEQLFDDVLKLQANGWCGFDRVSERHNEPLADIDLLYGGFECDDASSLNSIKQIAVGAIEAGTGRTGSTGRAALFRRREKGARLVGEPARGRKRKHKVHFDFPQPAQSAGVDAAAEQPEVRQWHATRAPVFLLCASGF